MRADAVDGRLLGSQGHDRIDARGPPLGHSSGIRSAPLGLAAFTVAAGLRGVHQSSRSARLGFGLLVVGALFVCLAGAFKDFLPHFAAGAVAIPSIILAALLLSWSFRQAAEWRPIHRATLLIALGMLVAFVSINTHLGMPGLLQRAFLLLFLLWLSIVAHRLATSRIV